MSTQQFKVCPQCQQPAVLTMQQCQRCGRPFNMSTQPFSKSSASQGFGFGFFACLGCAAAPIVVFLALFILGSIGGSSHKNEEASLQMTRELRGYSQQQIVQTIGRPPDDRNDSPMGLNNRYSMWSWRSEKQLLQFMFVDGQVQEVYVADL